MPYGFNDDKSKYDLNNIIETVDDLAENIAGNIATIETSPSTANHDEGEYLVYNSILHKVINAITAGEALVVGTNIEVTNVGDELSSLNVYSTSETVVGKWIDGKPIYRRAFTMNSFIQGETIDTGLANNTVDTLIRLSGTARDTANTFEIPFKDGNLELAIFFNFLTGTINKESNVVGLVSAMIIMEYTKTTD